MRKGLLSCFAVIFSILNFHLPLSAEVPSAPAASKPNEAEWQKVNLKARDLFNQGKNKEAIQTAQQALEIARRDLGETHPSYAKSLNNLGVLNFADRDYPKAREFYSQALANVEKNAGPKNIQSADILINVGKLEFAEKKYGEALTALDQALSISEKANGPSSPQVSMILEMLVYVYEAMGLKEEAKATYERLTKPGNKK